MSFEEDVSALSTIMVILATYMLVSKFMLPFSTRLVVALRDHIHFSAWRQNCPTVSTISGKQQSRMNSTFQDFFVHLVNRSKSAGKIPTARSKPVHLSLTIDITLVLHYSSTIIILAILQKTCS